MEGKISSELYQTTERVLYLQLESVTKGSIMPEVT